MRLPLQKDDTPTWACPLLRTPTPPPPQKEERNTSPQKNTTPENNSVAPPALPKKRETRRRRAHPHRARFFSPAAAASRRTTRRWAGAGWRSSPGPCGRRRPAPCRRRRGRRGGRGGRRALTPRTGSLQRVWLEEYLSAGNGPKTSCRSWFSCGISGNPTPFNPRRKQSSRNLMFGTICFSLAM